MALLFHGISFIIFFMLYLLIWNEISTVPFLTCLLYSSLFLISVPRVFLRTYFAGRGRPVQLPVHINHFPRHIPEQQLVTSPRFLIFVRGILPMGAVYTEFFFIMSSCKTSIILSFQFPF